LDGEVVGVAAEVGSVDALAGDQLLDRIQQVALAGLVGTNDRRDRWFEIDPDVRVESAVVEDVPRIAITLVAGCLALVVVIERLVEPDVEPCEAHISSVALV